jgi:hypothetical protein
MNDRDLVLTFMPRFHIHSNERYFSMYIDNYIACCTQSEDGLSLTVRDESIESCKTGGAHELQVLANVIELTDDTGKLVTDIVYYIFYPFSGGIGLFNSGEHWYDMEHVTLRFFGGRKDIKLESFPAKVLFSIHSKYRWFDWESRDLSKVDNRLHVYVAKGSHACYPRPGTYCRYFGVANDVCNDGYIPMYVNTKMYDATDPIFKYKSVCGNNQSNTWNRRELYFGEAPVYSSYANSIATYMFT